ncbi:hypothetical protein PVL29_012180 [Vitis rotundifolia]|uniref:Uncharacterized protein n=1 Tax=Vitis rotundifolia TaxID=103349 RepID=A0AA38ZQB2_VITRO|nr:hypothetical protein PVL29_012180 [Vitis rotundifolia]
MSMLQVFDMREKVIKREGVGVLNTLFYNPNTTHLDYNLCVCCVPVSCKIKTKYFCVICSRSLIITR